MELINRLTACGHEVKRVLPRVNCGGCGIYAAEIAMALYDLGITVWGVVAGPASDIENARRNNAKLLTIKDLDVNKIDMAHVLVQFEYRSEIWTHDTDKTTADVIRRDPKRSRYFESLADGYLTVPELVAIADEPGGWNQEFYRSEGQKVIRRAVRTHLTENDTLSVDSYRTAA